MIYRRLRRDRYQLITVSYIKDSCHVSGLHISNEVGLVVTCHFHPPPPLPAQIRPYLSLTPTQNIHVPAPLYSTLTPCPHPFPSLLLTTPPSLPPSLLNPPLPSPVSRSHALCPCVRTCSTNASACVTSVSACWTLALVCSTIAAAVTSSRCRDSCRVLFRLAMSESTLP